MPIRNFVYQSAETLIKKIIPALEKARQTGSTNELRVAGILTRTNKVSQAELATLYYQARYEIYLKGQPQYIKGARQDGDEKCRQFEPSNPWREKGMAVSSRSAVGVFGYPLPAPMVPPEP